MFPLTNPRHAECSSGPVSRESGCSRDTCQIRQKHPRTADRDGTATNVQAILLEVDVLDRDTQAKGKVHSEYKQTLSQAWVISLQQRR